MRRTLTMPRPVPLVLALVALVSASGGSSVAADTLPARAANLEAAGRAALARDMVALATDDFEAALVIAPANTTLLLDLGAAARRDGMPGKALHYYRIVLAREPHNPAAIASEGIALAEKGAIEKARRDLAVLQNLCGDGCPATRDLAAALAQGLTPRVLTAEAAKPKSAVNPD